MSILSILDRVERELKYDYGKTVSRSTKAPVRMGLRAMFILTFKWNSEDVIINISWEPYADECRVEVFYQKYHAEDVVNFDILDRAVCWLIEEVLIPAEEEECQG
jgi:hypothetical protein